MNAFAWARRLALAPAAALACTSAYAYRIPVDQCGAYAGLVHAIAEMRDIGADLEKYVAMQRRKARDAGSPGARFGESEIRRVYRLAAVSADDLAEAAYGTCIKNLGEMPEEREG